MTNALAGKPLIEIRRGGHIESVHHVAACACNPDGMVRLSVGNIEVPIFVRSALKPLIAVTVAAAAMDANVPLASEEVAIIAASHFGEPQHVAAVEQLLRRAGADESDLCCGAVWPRKRDGVISARPIYNNCSGKHAGLLYLCKLLGVDRADYLKATHPVNQAWMLTASRIYGIDVLTMPQGIDGCGLPVFALSLHIQAQGYARLATLRGITDIDRAAVDSVKSAMMAHPGLVGGSGHLDTRLMKAAPGEILAKIGAEGVHCSAVPAHDLALAVKVLDGHDRARPSAVIGFMHYLGLLSPAAITALEDIRAPHICNIAGVPIGDMRFSEESMLG